MQRKKAAAWLALLSLFGDAPAGREMNAHMRNIT
jgi:hypothetical protein